jgi:hypothetical protein
VCAAEVRPPRDHHARVSDRLLKRCEMDAWIAGGVMGQGRQRVAIGLRNVLSRDSATQSRQRRLVEGGDICMAGIRGARGDAFRTGLPRLFKNVGPFSSLEASGKPGGVTEDHRSSAHRGFRSMKWILE